MNLSVSSSAESAKSYVASRFWLQIVILLAVWWGCQSLVNATRMPLPGGVVGLLLLLSLLLGGWISPAWVKSGSKYLIDHLALFFLPAMVAFISHPEFMGWLGIKFIIAILVGTLSVMIGTALAVDFGFMLSQKNKPCETTLAVALAEIPKTQMQNQQLLAFYVNHSRKNLSLASRHGSRESLESGLE